MTSWSLGADYYRGRYTIKDSIITLDINAIERIIQSNKLVIRLDGTIDASGNKEASIYQLDSKGNVITGAVDFRVEKKQ